MSEEINIVLTLNRSKKKIIWAVVDHSYEIILSVFIMQS